MARHVAPATFPTSLDAEAWLAIERRLVDTNTWSPPSVRDQIELVERDESLFATYAHTWLTERDLKPRTRAHYASLLNKQLLPTFGPIRLIDISPAMIRAWHAGLGTDRPTQRAHAYGLLRTILGTAVDDRKIDINPCHIRGAGNSKRVRKIRPATLTELEIITANLPPRYQPMVLLASWCALRFGEITELRRKDIDLTNGIIHVRRGVTRISGQTIIGTPKSDAGVRDVAIPPHLVPLLADHINERVHGREALLFPATDGVSHMTPSTLYKVYYRARDKAGRPDLRWHDLRHTGAVLAAQSGATLAELMNRLGHSTAGAAMRYQHTAEERDQEIARRLSTLAGERP